MTSVELCVSSVDLCVTKRKIRTYAELHRDYTEDTEKKELIIGLHDRIAYISSTQAKMRVPMPL